MDGESEAIIRKVIELALSGDERALRLCMERLIPPCRERVVQLKLPPHITTPGGVAKAVAAILTAAAKGEVTPGEAVQLANVLEVRRKTIETEELNRRLTELEKRKEPPVESGLP